jgi:ribosomal protein L12E/L44/L45/RPP1/RPP2
MAETTADVRRDIEMTRERMSDTIAQLERKLNLLEVVREHPWPSVALAAGAGFALAGSRADVKAATATVKATGGASSKLGEVLDTAAASAITLLAGALEERIDAFVSDLKGAIGAPSERRPGPASPSMRDGALSGNGPAVARTGENTQAAVTNSQFVGAREPGRATELEQPM